jgi:hypothetical protein
VPFFAYMASREATFCLPSVVCRSLRGWCRSASVATERSVAVIYSNADAITARPVCRASPTHVLVIDRLRYVLAVVAIVSYPPGLLFWFLIHPFAAKWRTVGPLVTYSVVMPVLAIGGALLLRIREGVYGVIRHPRYLGALVGGIGYP